MPRENEDVTRDDTNPEGGAPAPAPAPDPSPDEEATSAFSDGVDSVSEAPEQTGPEDDSNDDQAGGGEPDKGSQEPADGEDDAEKGDEGEPETAPGAKKEDEPDPEVEKEIEGLGLKDKSASRFREMANTIKATSQELESLKRDAERGMEWERVVMESTNSPEQFSAAMSVLRAANSNDPATKGKAFEAMVNMVRDMGKELGRDIPGLVDPLADHADLARAVDEGDMTRQHALEVAQARVARAQSEQHAATQEQSRQRDQQIAEAGKQVQALADQLRQQDPDFDRKMPYLTPALDAIQAGLPPAQWAQAVAQAYRNLPALPAAPKPVQKPPVSAAPLRATGNSRGMKREPKDDMEAFELGVQSVGH